MPNARTHTRFGMTVGGVTAYAMVPKEAPTYQRAIETLGGLLGGYWGARLPDIIDPATSPNHRDIAHGLGTALVMGKLYMDRLPEWQASFRAKAEHYKVMAEAEQDGLKAVFLAIVSGFCFAIAGALAGLSLGFGSHLVLDFATPRCLPLVCRGF